MQFRPLFSFLGSPLRNGSRAFNTLIAGALLLAPGQIPLAQAQSAAGADVVIAVSNLRNMRGTVRVCMTNNPRRFPRCNDDAGSHRLVVAANAAATVRFHNVAPGTYAIALLHDENDNGRADRALSMIPREGFGFSRDAPVRMGPPDFEDAAITVTSTELHQTIRMRYML